MEFAMTTSCSCQRHDTTSWSMLLAAASPDLPGVDDLLHQCHAACLNQYVTTMCPMQSNSFGSLPHMSSFAALALQISQSIRDLPSGVTIGLSST